MSKDEMIKAIKTPKREIYNLFDSGMMNDIVKGTIIKSMEYEDCNSEDIKAVIECFDEMIKQNKAEDLLNVYNNFKG